MDAIAVTDHGAMFGTIDFYKACKANGVKTNYRMRSVCST